MRSSTCFSSTSVGGAGVPCSRSWTETTRMRSSRSRRVITSSFTTATMRSSSMMRLPGACAAACPLVHASTASSMDMPVTCEKLINDLPRILAQRKDGIVGANGLRGSAIVTGDVTSQQFQRTGADFGNSVQFELHEKGIDRGRRRGCETVGDDAKRPAAAVVFEPRQPFQEPAVGDRIIHACDGA